MNARSWYFQKENNKKKKSTLSQRHNESAMLSIAEKSTPARTQGGVGRLGDGGGVGYTVTLIRDDGVGAFSPSTRPGTDAIAAIGVAISATITSAHSVLTHVGEIMPERTDKINPASPAHLLPLFSPSFCTLHKRSMRLRTYPGIFRRVLIAPLGEGAGGPPGRRLASTLLSLCFGSS